MSPTPLTPSGSPSSTLQPSSPLRQHSGWGRTGANVWWRRTAACACIWTIKGPNQSLGGLSQIVQRMIGAQTQRCISSKHCNTLTICVWLTHTHTKYCSLAHTHTPCLTPQEHAGLLRLVCLCDCPWYSRWLEYLSTTGIPLLPPHSFSMIFMLLSVAGVSMELPLKAWTG